MKNIKIYQSPMHSPMAEAEGIVIALNAPCSKNEVTIIINGNLTQYDENQDNADIQVRQVTTIKGGERITMDFNRNKEIILKNKDYGLNHKITLLNIEKEKVSGIDNQEFFYFEFMVEKL